MNSFNLFYIDGDHCFESVTQDISTASQLLQDDGFLCGDDLSLKADEVDIEIVQGAIKSGHQFIHDPKTKTNYHPGVTGSVLKNLGKVSKYVQNEVLILEVRN